MKTSTMVGIAIGLVALGLLGYLALRRDAAATEPMGSGGGGTTGQTVSGVIGSIGNLTGGIVDIVEGTGGK